MLPFSSSGEVLESPPSLTLVAQPSAQAKGPAVPPLAGGAQLPVSSVTEVRSATLSQGLMSPPLPPPGAGGAGAGGAGVGGAGAGGAGSGASAEPRPAAFSARGVQLPVSASEGRGGIAPGPVGPPAVAAPEVRGASSSLGLLSPAAPAAEGKAGAPGAPAPAAPEVRGAGQSLGLRSPPRPMITETRGSGTLLGAGGSGAAGDGAGGAGSGASEPKTGFGAPGRPPMPSLRGVGPRPSAPTPASPNPTTSHPAEGEGAERPPLRDRPAFGLKKE